MGGLKPSKFNNRFSWHLQWSNLKISPNMFDVKNTWLFLGSLLVYEHKKSQNRWVEELSEEKSQKGGSKHSKGVSDPLGSYDMCGYLSCKKEFRILLRRGND